MRQAIGQAAQNAGRIAVAQLLLDARTIVALVEIIADQVEPGVAIRFPGKRAAHRIEFAAIDVAIVIFVVGEAVPVEPQAGNADAEGISQRQVEHRLGFFGIVIAVLEFAAGVDSGEIGFGGNEIDHARGRVAAEQRALRAAQHLDPFQVIELAFEQASRYQRHVVDVDRGRAVARRAGAQVANAADGEARRGEIGLGETDVGQRLLQRCGVDDLLLLEVLCREGGNRDRHVLQSFGLALGGNDDILNTRVGLVLRRAFRRRCGRIGRGFGRRCLCEGWGRRKQCDGGRSKQFELLHGRHPLLPDRRSLPAETVFVIQVCKVNVLKLRPSMGYR